MTYKSDPFLDYARQNDIELLKGDIIFIRDCAYKLSTTTRRETLKKYVEIWKNEMRKEVVDYKRQNMGRRKANLWLLNACEGLNINR